MTETEKIQRRYESKYYPKVRKVIQGEVDYTANVLEREGFSAAIKYAEGNLFGIEMMNIVKQLYIEIGGMFARRTWIDLNKQKRKGFGFNAQWVQDILDFFRQYLFDKVLINITQTTREILLSVLNRGITEGWGLEKTLRYMRDEDQFTLAKYQAARIVRTEATRASNAGVYAAGKTFPFEQTKEWISAHDSRTRGQEKNPHASHVLLDGQVIDFEDVFIDSINFDRLLFPGDPKGSAASVINCRCNIALVAKVDSDGRLIDKVKKRELVHGF